MLGLLGLSTVAWGWQRFGLSQPDLEYDPIPGLPNWRVVQTSAISGGSASTAVFLGIGDNRPEPLAIDRLCDILYSSAAPGLPVAVFSDINCPNCRMLEAKLAARAYQLAITWLELPLLGPGSVAAARISATATLLSGGNSSPPARGLRGTGVDALVRHHSERTGVPVGRILDEMNSPAVDAILSRHAGAAERLGVWGTPAFAIGQTLVMGDVPSSLLDQLIAMEHKVCR